MSGKNNINEEVETLMLDDQDTFQKTTTLEIDDITSDVEMLDFEADTKVANEIDEMLDFAMPEEKKDFAVEKEKLDNLLNTVKEETKLEIDASKKKLDEYKPSIKDFNIKSARTRKIIKKSMLYVIIVMLIGFEFFINKSGDVLNDLKVYANDEQPIRIVQNEKYGFIDSDGNKIVNPKYVYADNFIKGYAIVKNSSNLPLIINKGGKEVVPTGNYFSLYRAGSDIIASKTTKAGLKYGVLNSDLREKIPFEYDSIYYIEDAFSFVKGNTVGIINKDGKEIFKYKLTNDDDKVIEVNKSKVEEGHDIYAVVKVNGTSQIINMDTGKNVSSPTLNKVVAESNNVFYEVIDANSRRYLYVQGDKVLLESDSYKSLTMESIDAGVLKAINNDYEYEFISTKSLEQIKKGLKLEEVFFGEGIFMYKERNFKKNTNTIVLVKNGEVIKKIDGAYEVYEGFVNGFAILKYDDGTYGYINDNGNFINEDRYVEASSFDSYGDAIAKKHTGYGVVNKNGKTIIPFENNDIRMAPSKVKKITQNNSHNVFYAVKKENKFILYDSKGKKVNKKFYTDIVFDKDYPFYKAATDTMDLIVTMEDKKEIKLTSFNTDYNAYDNYIIIENEYYNYDGKLIYTHVDTNGGE